MQYTTLELLKLKRKKSFNVPGNESDCHLNLSLLFMFVVSIVWGTKKMHVIMLEGMQP